MKHTNTTSELTTADLVERYALDNGTMHSQENRRQMQGESLSEVRAYVYEYAVEQNLYPEDVECVDDIAERIHNELNA